MGMNNFTTQDPNDPNGGNANGNGGAPGIPGMAPPSMGGASKPGADIDELLINYNERFKNADPTLFRDGLITQTISVLIGKDKPNPLLVGSAGVGKTKIVEDIARRIAVGDPLIPDPLKKSTIYELPLSNLMAGAGIVGELEQRLTGLVDYVCDPDNDAVLFIDEIHQILDTKESTYKKVAQILKPALARGDMRVIGATTSQEGRSFDDDPAFQRRFSRLIVDEITRSQTVEVLKTVRGSYLRHYRNKVSITDAVLEDVAAIADQNSRADQHRPDNALTLMDRTMADVIVAHTAALAHAHHAGDQATVQALQAISTLPVTEKKLSSVASQLMTGMATRPGFNEARVRAGMQRLQGQDEVSESVVEMLRRDHLAVFPRTKPISWMFAGPSGVGKTEMAKIIAEELTGQAPIILNMGEYSDKHDSSKILGSPPGYVGSDSNQEKPLDALESNPHRVIVLDEMEKADHTIQSLFLSGLDEGYLRTAAGKVIDLSKAVIIATTNAARDSLTRPRTGFQTAAALTARLTHQELVTALKAEFKPEFLGRFTDILAFNKLGREVYREILVSSYQRERARILAELPRKGAMIPVDIDEETLNSAVIDTYLPEQGARPAEQTARRLIEDALLGPVSPAGSATPAAASAAEPAAQPGDRPEQQIEQES